MATLGLSSEARWLVEEAAGSSWPAVLDEAVAVRAAASFESGLARRAAGEPLQYVIGHWSFRNLDVLVDRRVLIPRPETEITVEVALSELDRIRAASAALTTGASAAATVVDLGTGSGVIALAMATERQGLSVWATDASSDALDVTRANLAGVAGSAATRVRIVHGRWWEALPEELAGSVDLVVSNPPYVSAEEMTRLDAGVADWEPASALRAGCTGLEDVAEIVGDARRWLAPGGGLVVEIAPHQAAPVVALATDAGLLGAQVRPDLVGRPRVLVARSPGP
ncbi:MAG: peptide chain release factor N(5)-glutamine methyltransferase [Actinomycetota bacterium]|nr:peptide chain release factor N(5)-glutamine methyltransferase [Actinomycetota bacterium]